MQRYTTPILAWGDIFLSQNSSINDSNMFEKHVSNVKVYTKRCSQWEIITPKMRKWKFALPQQDGVELIKNATVLRGWGENPLVYDNSVKCMCYFLCLPLPTHSEWHQWQAKTIFAACRLVSKILYPKLLFSHKLLVHLCIGPQTFGLLCEPIFGACRLVSKILDPKLLFSHKLLVHLCSWSTNFWTLMWTTKT